ncbi:Hypothetical protein DHA2_152862 [Giardia duodenalis]|uniref:DNA2/NAM7 helicase-like C-terminal domain-containing protein n=1 Tax=Giardia intestinalis TaxID=5741 RepID=V6T9Y6_GIAIN|nr:Hypothetical protein DHA2_152862 [Giardia intestinalis]
MAPTDEVALSLGVRTVDRGAPKPKFQHIWISPWLDGQHGSMDTKTLLRYKWTVDGVINDRDSSFPAALHAAFLHFAAPDIATLGRDHFFPPLLHSCDASQNHVETVAVKLRPIGGRAAHSDAYLWTELHSGMSAAGASEALLQHLLPVLRQRDSSDQAFRHVVVASYVCASVLLYEGLVLGRLHYIASECADGRAFLVLANALELSLPACRGHLHVLDPCLSLLTRLLPYIPYCIDTEYPSRVVDLLRPRLRSGQPFLPADPTISGVYFTVHELVDPRKQFRSNQLINLCLNILVDAHRDLLIVSIPEGTTPSQNVRVRMLLVSCLFLLSALCIFEGYQQLSCIDYIESILSFRLLKDYNSPHRGTVLLSLVFDLLKTITNTGRMSVGVRLFLCEFIFALVTCSYYHHLPCIQASFYVDRTAKNKKMQYFRELMANKSQKDSSLSFQTLNECINMMLHGVVLGNIMHRYDTGTLFLCSTLLAPACSLGYLWVKSYHSLAEIYSAITVELLSDSSTFCNPKHTIRGLTFEDSGRLALYVDEEVVRGRIRYGDNGRLEQYPFIYQVALPEKTIQAIYVARTCQLCSQLQKGADGCTSTDKTTSVFNIQLAEAEFNTYMLREAYRAYATSPGSLAFYISWTHPSVSLHLDAAQCIAEYLLDLYYRRFDDMSPNFSALALGRYDKLRLPCNSCICYGYAAVSDRDPSYIEGAMGSIYQTLTTMYRTPVHLRLSPASSTDPRTSILIDISSSDLEVEPCRVTLTEPALEVGTQLVPRKQLLTEKTLRPSQFKALVYAVLSPLLLILGCPGSGKSTSLSLISKVLLLTKGADSKWIRTSLDIATGDAEWRAFSSAYASSIRTYASCLDMLTDIHLGMQLFLVAHSNNAADQLAKYILTADNWAAYTIPFTVRIGERSSDPFVHNFMPLQYLVNVATELRVTEIDFAEMQNEISSRPSHAFSALSKKILRHCEANRDSLPICSRKYNLLKFILSDYMVYISWLMNHATIVVGTISGVSSRVQFLQKQSERFEGDPLDVRERGHQMIQTIVDVVGGKSTSKKANRRTDNGDLAMRMINYRCQKNSARHIIIEEAARLAEHELALLLLLTFDKLILIGDVLQLPPLIQDCKLTSTVALDWSLFHRLCYSSREGIPIVTLEEQARSVPEIADLYRSLYESRLPKSCCVKGGLRDIPNVTFKSYIDSVILSEFKGRCFFCLPDNLDKPAVQRSQINNLLKNIHDRIALCPPPIIQSSDTKKLLPDITDTRNCYISEQEKNAALILLLRIIYRTISNSSTPQSKALLLYNPAINAYEVSISVALLSLYHSQKQYILSDPVIAVLRNMCSDTTFTTDSDTHLKVRLNLDVETSDGYQGLEADVVFLSLSGSRGNEFRNNLCRSLVAVSRARRLFVCIGAVDQYDNQIWRNVSNTVPCPGVQTVM